MPWVGGGRDERVDPLAALDAVPYGVFVYDLEGRCVFLNPPAVRDVEGVGVEDPVHALEGRRWSEVFPDRTEGAFAEAFERVASGETDEAVVDEESPGGAVLEAHLRRLEGWIVVSYRDVTEARELASDFRLLIRRYPFGGIMIFDDELRYRYAGGRGFDDIEVDPEWMVGRTIWEVWPEETAAILEEYFRRALDGEESETRIPYGGYEYLCWIAPLAYAGDTVDRAMIVTWEITETVRHREDLRLVQAALSALDLGVTIADARAPDLPLVFANEGFTRLTGYDRDEILGRNCRFLQGEETDEDAVSEVREAIRAEESVQVALRNYRKDGTPFWNRLSVFPIRNEGDEVTHFLGVQEDVSKQREMGEQLQRSERLSAVGRLAGGVAHDIRNVLTGIGGLLELTLVRDDLPGEVIRDLEEAVEIVGRGSSVTGRLLTFSRVGMVEKEEGELNAMVRERIDFLTRVLRDDIDVVFEPCPDEAWIRIDPGQLDQTLINLTSNAEDAMPAGGEIRISVWCDLPDEGVPPHVDRSVPWAGLSVLDTGEGMGPAELDKAFEPFFTTKTESGGTGLGLSSVYGAVTQSSGEIWIDSELGEGTSVNILLPRVSAPDREESDAGDGSGDGTASGTILVVEDDAAVRRVCERALRDAGFEVLTAPDGEAGLAMFEEHADELSLVLTDAVMPGLSGPELVREIRSRTASLPIILSSGYTEEGVDEVEVGRVRYMEKPFDVEALLAGVRDALHSAADPSEA